MVPSVGAPVSLFWLLEAWGDQLPGRSLNIVLPAFVVACNLILVSSSGYLNPFVLFLLIQCLSHWGKKLKKDNIEVSIPDVVSSKVGNKT